MTAPIDSEPFVYTARAHSKVNIHLGVEEPREDGFHELASVFQSLELHDTVTLTDLGNPEVDKPRIQGLKVTGPHAQGVPEDYTNLAWTAVNRIMQYLYSTHGPKALPEVALEIHKAIPTAGGMAGGSADAAAALRLAERCYGGYYGIDLVGEPILDALGAALGSDVPFTLLGGTALGTGRGEQLTPMMTRGTYDWALIASDRGLSTPQVFHKLDEMREKGRGGEPHMDTAAVSQALISGDPHRVAQHLHNDLQPAALSLRPDLRKTLEAGVAAGALAGIVSGSGPTCAFLCAGAEEAQEVVSQVTVEIPGTKGVATKGPASGAVVL
ncbi:4-(cytidine 5'-diphospho)-2-C-methyl-D-erythritol kinase [Corynebacterium kefirresidentii]|uniref:4-(cytidine 5'-diphospho)-2-C-methyl-D-erythritol kinase n=1 Tax=Corynebacterium TaxID=1716 RepID=UPI001EF1A0A1|nr:4-(cytidine 5'-diphospho)-2-C-methyl-D-erythritol kinase [Corynebacterium kefirresidentii]MCG7449871.1 4-(cytidine 5'-diphospho)-2-C-methyl-D-erythritol kinase [Corynebacterium kefirresidentii]MCG7451681.1 4-(cytidine 5'-diphospho)-2-C-methyl-D-erythritol kinase [Corynebacterium kefirresidentii]